MFGQTHSLPFNSACILSHQSCEIRAHRLKALQADRAWSRQKHGAPSPKRLTSTHAVTSDLYSLLQVEPTASAEEIKTAYRRLARKHHPDVTSKAAASFQVCQRCLASLHAPVLLSRPNGTRICMMNAAALPIVLLGACRPLPALTLCCQMQPCGSGMTCTGRQPWVSASGSTNQAAREVRVAKLVTMLALHDGIARVTEIL